MSKERFNFLPTGAEEDSLMEGNLTLDHQNCVSNSTVPVEKLCR